MAITNRRHIRKILNDLEAINRNDVFRYTRGHLSVAQNRTSHATKFSGQESLPTKSGPVTSHKVAERGKLSSESLVPVSQLCASIDCNKSGCIQPVQTETILYKSSGDDAKDFFGITKAEQLHNFTAKSQNALKELQKTRVLQMTRIEQTLSQDLQRCKRIEGTEKDHGIHIYEIGKDAFERMINHSNVFSNLLGSIKIEFESYISHLIKNDDHRGEVIKMELKSLAISSDLEKLRSLEDSVTNLEKVISQVSSEIVNTRGIIEDRRKSLQSITPPVLDPSASKCRLPRKISQAERVHMLRNDIASREQVILKLFSHLRANNVPKGQYKSLFATARDLQAEVNSLSAGCRMLNRKIKGFESEFETLLQQVEMSDRDARILDEVLNDKTTDTLHDGNDPFEIIGKIEIGEISLLDFERLEGQVESEPWRSYIS